MTTSPLKVEDSRADFEAWAEEVGALPWGYLKKQRTPGGGYSVQIYNYMWSAWQASRAAIVVELPEPYDDGHGNLWLPQDATANGIRAAGITVKGD
ncbi:hypothetical protein [Buttiauxella sp.]|uniref:hypothetical protein n=1 Tax=Buttiauxella sp. TaxID=1972222 RepID=UPI003C7701F7